MRLGAGAARVERAGARVVVTDARGDRDVFDRVILATHADEALALLAQADGRERALLGAFRYSRNTVYLHLDERMMPRRRAAWASWNYRSEPQSADHASVTYWMNNLQPLSIQRNVFVTLNPARPPRDCLHAASCDHPIFDAAALRAQKDLWSLQGRGGVWFCGAHFGAGFHEDGLQAGLAVAEQLGGVRRPWRVQGESARIVVGPPPAEARAMEAAA
jgi:predicted NAD/FAD-binding protein